MNAPVAVFAVGNRSRGDDALGPALLDRLAGWLEARGLGGRFELFEEYQLQVENALDLEGRRLALFIDAWQGAPSAAVLRKVEPHVTSMSCDSHRLEPAGVLEVHRRVTGRLPPPAFALGVRAERFGLGEGLSDASKAAFEEAWPLLESLAGDPRLASWQALASTYSEEEETPMATRKSPATTQVGTVKAPAAPKGGARSEVVKKPARAPVETAAPAAKSPAAKSPAAKSPAAKSPAAKSPAAKSPAAKSPAPEAPATRPRKLVPKAPQRPAPDRIVMVAQAAYYRAERRGFAPGGEMDDWLAAEEEIARLLAAR